jgi:hypothetical protein
VYYWQLHDVGERGKRTVAVIALVISGEQDVTSAAGVDWNPQFAYGTSSHDESVEFGIMRHE